MPCMLVVLSLAMLWRSIFFRNTHTKTRSHTQPSVPVECANVCHCTDFAYRVTHSVHVGTATTNTTDSETGLQTVFTTDRSSNSLHNRQVFNKQSSQQTVFNSLHNRRVFNKVSSLHNRQVLTKLAVFTTDRSPNSLHNRQVFNKQSSQQTGLQQPSRAR